MPLITVPHIPSCPTTSYNGDWRTKNSSRAFAEITRDVSLDGVFNRTKEKTTLTESVQGGSSEHEHVTFDLIHCCVVLIGELIGSDEHPKAANTDQDTL